MFSTQLWGRNSNGKIKFIGQKDDDGYRIGYIEDRFCWESRAERDESLAVGRWSDAVKAWAQAGEIGPMPAIETFMALMRVDPRNVQAVYKSAKIEYKLIMPIYMNAIRNKRLAAEKHGSKG